MTRLIKVRAYNIKDKVMTYDRPMTWTVASLNQISNTWIVMQFTGLHDKHGNEIYEGDIIQCEKTYWVVKWDYAEFAAERNDCELLAPVMWNETEVIGNICEHGHLLEST